MTKSWTNLLLIGASALTLVGCSTANVADEQSQLIAKLSSSNEGAVISTMTRLKKGYLHSPAAIQAIKKLLTDSRLRVKERAAGWLGISHATVSEEDVKAICTLLKEPDARANTEGLKALRGVHGPAVAEAVPDVLPFLKSSNSHLMRDACRTLAVIGSKDLIPQIEPLLNNPEHAVRLDAQNAISRLQSKS
jgi:HEAT repeat protein